VTIYPIKIILSPGKARYFYFIDFETQKNWNKILKYASGYSNVSDFYEVGETIRKDQFGEMKVGHHKETNK
jgi:hypothetical protein